MIEVKKSIENYLREHHAVDDSVLIVSLHGITELGFEIEIFTYMKTIDLFESKRLTDEFNYEINVIVDSIGVEFSRYLLMDNA